MTTHSTSTHLSGRYHSIPKDPAGEFPKATLAAGAVLWREEEGELQVAVVHRPHYDDWSLPKGKVDPGESLPATAAREIWEETGYQPVLDQLLGTVTYPVKGRTKVVYYWTAHVTGGGFLANEEVDELRWVTVEVAQRLLSYDVDVEVMRTAATCLRARATSRIILVRHGHAHQRRNWGGDDDRRPLDKKGRRQAEMLVPMLLVYRPDAFYSAHPERCQLTTAPLADELGLDVTVDALYGDQGWATSMTRAQHRLEDIIAAGGTSVVVSQGRYIPEAVAWLAANGTLPLGEIRAKKASCWVLSFRQGALVAAEYLASPLPVK
ncbi:NUDIX hydrolase [Corynebacterium sp. zg-331]|uniref:NUDIX hydrolase n=1 Tax=unclassified Corynebacterium TaxID=2624378 RepID=UPI00128E3073|nr:MULTISPECIES: bifunctional NUDIX hydrolase/histidine phosphatase family protein [unclassified Corynebacterium]MBC3186259.1 NUDIX hydrolase [Corynebacterium sp. zg-331]MPV52746.1 NUDIX domain-containing protein [Corynebacterium sp. zg331]